MTTRPAAPTPTDEVAATAILPAAGVTCPSCRKANHPGVPQCVFCGGAVDSGTQPTAAAHAAPDSVPPSRGGGWSEHGEPPPPSRRPQLSSDSGEMAAAPIADPLIGVVVAERYRIVEPLGRGGMGIVYKVEHVRIGKLLAMKLLTGELSRNPEVVRRFKQEALTASKLSCPNTVQVFDFGVSEGLTYLVMELVTGEDLARGLRSTGPLPWHRLGKIVIQVCASLAEAHQKGIVHRDVKPENVMLLRARDGTDVAKVLDFGLAKVREGAELNDVTSQGAIVGTPYFMSPEQIRGEAVDHRTDIYALGALMYRALTGHYPFNGPTPMAVFTKHLTEVPVPPVVRAPELAIPASASSIVMKALSKSPADRYAKVEDLQAAIVAEMKGAGTTSVEDLLDSGQVRRLAKVAAEAEAHKVVVATRDEVERYERKLRRQRWSAFVAMGAVLAGVGYGGYRLYVHERAELRKGHEVEPNDTAPQATPLPFGTSIVGFLGKRPDSLHGDRDFYAVDVPASTPGGPALVDLKVTALPNFATCTMLYRKGQASALGQYCVGRPARDLRIPTLRLEPGRYLLAVLQDLDTYGGPQVFLHENVSDPYTVTVAASAAAAGTEIEPNDAVASANPIAPGAAVKGTLAWTRDEDVFCLPPGAPGAIRWKVRDEQRDAGAVLEATPMAGTLEGAPVRVHTSMGKAFQAPPKPTAEPTARPRGHGQSPRPAPTADPKRDPPPSTTDVQTPWQSEWIAPDADSPRCLRLRVTNDPWSGDAAARVPAGSDEVYTVEVEQQ